MSNTRNEPGRDAEKLFLLEPIAISSLRSTIEKALQGPHDMSMDLLPEEVSRRRFNYNPRKVYFPDYRWNKAFNLYYNVIDRTTSDEIHSRLDRLNIYKIRNNAGLRSVLGELSTIAKKNGESFSESWDFYVGMEDFSGYQQVVEEQLLEKGLKWISKKYFPTWYIELFEQAVGQIVQEWMIPTKLVDMVSDFDFFSDITNWATSGSSSEPARIVIKNKYGQDVRVKKTKLSYALVTPTGKVVDLARARRKQVAKLVPKREVGKIRAVIASDMSTYLKMTYLSHYIDSLINTNQSPLWLKNSQAVLEMWERLSSSSSNWNFPFDQSAFDQHVALSMVLLSIEKIRDRVLEFYDTQEIRVYFSNILYALKDSTMEYKGINYPVKGGILSGWRWTAMLDTIINAAQLRTWQLYETNMGGYPVFKQSVFQGDDIALTMSDPTYAQKYFNFMTNLGYEVHPKKVFLNKGRNEFLRKVITPDKVKGYPARTINSILWRNPVNPEPPKGKYRASEILNQWSSLISRGASLERCLPYLIRDISHACDISKDDVKSLLSTPKCLGGLGFDISYNYKWKSYDDQTESLVNDINAIDYPGLNRPNIFWDVKDMKIKPNSLGSWNKPITKYEWVLKDEQYLYPRKGYRDTMNNIRMQPVWKKTVPRVFLNEYIASAFRKGFNGFGELMEYPFDWDYLRHKSSKRVQLLWLTGNLPFHSPYSIYFDNLIVNRFYEARRNATWSNILGLSKINTRSILIAAFTIELEIQDRLKAYRGWYISK